MVESLQLTRPKAEKLRKTNWWRATEAVAKSPAGAVAVTIPGRLAQPHELAEDIPPVRFASVAVRSGCSMRNFHRGGRFRCDLNELISPEKSAKSRRLEKGTARGISAAPHS